MVSKGGLVEPGVRTLFRPSGGPDSGRREATLTWPSRRPRMLFSTTETVLPVGRGGHGNGGVMAQRVRRHAGAASVSGGSATAWSALSNRRGRSGRMARRLVAPVAVLGVVSLLGIPGARAHQNPPVNQPGVTISEIHVGGVATVTGDPTGQGQKTAAAFDGVKAYFDYINTTQRGVYGRKLVLTSKRDDGLGNNRSEVQGLLSQDNVFAVAPVAVQLFSGADLLAQSGTPTFGGN